MRMPLLRIVVAKVFYRFSSKTIVVKGGYCQRFFHFKNVIFIPTIIRSSLAQKPFETWNKLRATDGNACADSNSETQGAPVYLKFSAEFKWKVIINRDVRLSQRWLLVNRSRQMKYPLQASSTSRCAKSSAYMFQERTTASGLKRNTCAT